MRQRPAPEQERYTVDTIREVDRYSRKRSVHREFKYLNPVSALVLAALVLTAPLAFAAGSCTGLSVTALTFGSYAGTAISVTATVTVNCTNGYAYTLGIGGGNSGTSNARTMTNGAAALNYGLFQDAGHTIKWADHNGIDTESKTGTGANQTFTIYGLLPSAQYGIPEAYSDVPIVYVLGGSFVYLNVSATIVSNCQISASTMAFGNYTGVANVNSTFTVSVLCTDTTAYALGINAGLHSGGTSYNWELSGSSSFLSYKVYRDFARTMLWGGTQGLDTESGTGNGSTQSVIGYGQIPSSQYPAPGSYTDTVQLIIYY